MRLLNPAGLFLLLGIIVLIVIYIIRSRYQDRAVSSTYLWILSRKFMKKRLPIQRFRKIFLFLLQLVLILSFALLAARPAIENGKSLDYILILDASGSMQTKDDKGISRFEYAVDQISDFADKTLNGHSVSVILATEHPSYLVQSSRSANEIKLALNNAKCENGSCDVSASLSLAQLLCDRTPNEEVIFFTDTQYDQTKNVSVVNLNQNEWNVSVGALKFSSTDFGKTTTLSATITSFHRDSSVPVGLRINGELVDAGIVDCKVNEETSVEFILEDVVSYDTASVYVDLDDGLELDNSYAVCRKSDKVYRVLLASSRPLYLKSALEALGNCEVTVKKKIAQEDLVGMDLYIFDGIYPEVYPEDGSVIQFGAEKLPDLLISEGTYTQPAALLMENSKNSEVFEGLGLKETVVTNYTSLQSKGSWDSLMYCADSSVLMTRDFGGGIRFSVLSFDLHDSNLPMQTDYVKFVKNLVEYSVPGLLTDTDRLVGETLQFTVPQGEKELYLEYPDESLSKLDVLNNTAQVKLDNVGIYTAILKDGENSEYVDFFVHVPDEEFDFVSDDVLEMQISFGTLEENQEAVSEIWFWFALAMLVILLVEWGWYYREQF